jgi:PKD repeat protein
MEAIPSMRVSAILESANHHHPKMPFEIPSKGDHFPHGRIDQTVEKMICTQAPLALKTDPTKEGYAMTNYLHRFDKCFAAFLCLLFFVVCLLMLPIQTIACTDSGRMIRTINVVTSESVSFTYTPASPVKGQPVQFTDTSTGSPILWRWDFGDGTGTTSTSKNPSYTYTTGGTYMVTLTVLYSSGPERGGQMVTVVSELTASFTYSPSSPAEGQAVQFTDKSTGSPTSWQWSFGDGQSSTSKNPSHAYTTAATYTVTLTVANSSGSNNASQTVSVAPALAASFTYSPSSPAQGQAVQFTDTSTGNRTSWLWNFGDGVTNTSQNPNHSYATAGSYWVSLTIMNGLSSNSTTQMIIVRQSNIITAASPSFADVSAAISSANSGDTVIIPAGSATWNSQLIITKGICLIGAGMANTVITSNYTPTSPNYLDPKSFMISYYPSNPSANEPCRISGFTIDCASKCHGIMLYNTTINVINKVRVDHTKILNPRSTYSSRYCVTIYGPVYGVADNNEWHGFYMQFFCPDSAWSYFSFDFGTADIFYLEDNTFVGYGAQMTVSAAAGTRYCFRHNIFDGSAMTNGVFPQFDAHGNAAWSGTMGVELYENVTTLPAIYGETFFDHRGGKAVVYNNTTYCSSAGIEVREEYNDNLSSPSSGPTGQPQHVSDSYYWGNRYNNGTSHQMTIWRTDTVDYGGSIGIVPQANRDFWNETASFDGTVGVGVGPIASRPATCTKGVGYWATDTNTLYRATATNVWTAYYTPYTYPHPLRTSLSTPAVDENK